MAEDTPGRMTPAQITDLAARLFVAYKHKDRDWTAATDKPLSDAAIKSAQTFAAAVYEASFESSPHRSGPQPLGQ